MILSPAEARTAAIVALGNALAAANIYPTAAPQRNALATKLVDALAAAELGVAAAKDITKIK